MHGDGFGGCGGPAPGSGWDSSSGPDWPQGGNDGAGRTIAIIGAILLVGFGVLVAYAQVKEHEKSAKPKQASCVLLPKQEFENIVGATPAMVDEGPQCDYTTSEAAPALQITVSCGDEAAQDKATLKNGDTVSFGKAAPHAFMTGDGKDLGQVGVPLTIGSDTGRVKIFLEFNYQLNGGRRQLAKIVHRAYRNAKSASEVALCGP